MRRGRIHDGDEAENAVGTAVARALEAVREEARAHAYLFDDPGSYQAGIDHSLTAAERELTMELAEAVYEQVDVLTHEIASPATTIRVGVETLNARAGRLTEADRAALFESLCRSAEYLSFLLRKLRGPQDAQPEARIVDVEQLLREAVEDENLALGSTRVRLAPVPGHVLAKIGPYALRRIVSALLSNAVKYGDPDGAITVTVEATERHVEIRVADEGPGIPTDQQTAVFEKFRRFRGDAPGSGLGLYLARRLAREHDGELTVEQSETGQGAVLLLCIRRTSVDLSGDDGTAGRLAPEAVAT